MFGNKTLTKEQLLKALEELEKNPQNRLGILADIGVGVVGAAGAGYAASVLGASAIFFGLIPVAAPVAVVAGGAALGGLAFVGIKKMLFDGTYDEGKRDQIRIQLEENLKDIEAKEKASNLGENDKNQFYTFLKEPVKFDLISPEDAQGLINAVESGKMSLKEAYHLVKDVINSAKS
ncbi:hypothetical protein [Allocoleopsis sp.]|uniref:hypothetical protein n=1 Tax=Allocoleopsis sp. TaxID=3088169 RepID=UPI002FD059C5